MPVFGKVRKGGIIAFDVPFRENGRIIKKMLKS